jgi:hypothetical protein
MTKGTCHYFLVVGQIEVRLLHQKKTAVLLLISSRRQLWVEKGLFS